MLEVRPLALAGVAEIVPAQVGDERGFFSEVWSQRGLREAGYDLDFVQDNHARSQARGVLRGLHYQTPPAAQDKLVRVTRGSIFDVAVDIRRGSPTFGKWTSLVVSSTAWNQVLIPKGFAHGFVTLEDDTEVLYKVTAPYAPACDRAMRFDDPAIGVGWPMPASEMTLSPRDRNAPMLADADLDHDWS